MNNLQFINFDDALDADTYHNGTFLPIVTQPLPVFPKKKSLRSLGLSFSAKVKRLRAHTVWSKKEIPLRANIGLSCRVSQSTSD